MPAKSKTPPHVNTNAMITNFALPAAAILISVLLFIFLVIPKTLNYFKTSSTIDETQKETDQLTVLANSLQQIDVSQYQSNLETTKKVLPDVVDAPASVNQVQAVLSQNNLQLAALSFNGSNTSSAVTKGPASSFVVAMETKGNLDSVKAFINQVESAPRIMKLNDLSLSSGKDGSVDATMTLSIYYQEMAKTPKSFNTPVQDLTTQDKVDLGKIEDRANQPNLVAAPPQGTTGKPDPFQ